MEQKTLRMRALRAQAGADSFDRSQLCPKRVDDLTAFVLANTFDNGFTRLLGALIVGIVVGLVGGAIEHNRALRPIKKS